jgi:excisionase family DNA binding protein
MDDLNDLITITEAANRAGVSRNTIHRAAKSEALKAVQIGRNWFVYASDIDRWKKENYRPDKSYRYPPKEDKD